MALVGKRLPRLHMHRRSWGEVMLRFGEAGLTVSAVCAREGMHTSSFHRWGDRLGSVCAAKGASRRRGGRSKPAVPHNGASFIELGRLSAPIRNADAGLKLRPDLGAGVVLHIVRRYPHSQTPWPCGPCITHHLLSHPIPET